MIYLLLILLIVLFGIALYINKGDIISPWVISISVFGLSTFVAILNIKRWELVLSFKCLAVIVGALAAFGLGEWLIQKFVFKEKKSIPLKEGTSEISVIITLLVSVFMFIGLMVVFRRVYAISAEAGNTNGIMGILVYARGVMVTPGNHLGRLCNHITICSQAVAYIFLFVFIKNMVERKISMKVLLYLIPVMIYITIDMLGTGRAFVIQLFVFILITYTILSQNGRGWTYKSILKIMLLGAAALGIYLMIFLVLGIMRTANYKGVVFNYISIYVGSSIANLNEYLKQPVYAEYFGEETLYGIFNVLRAFGVNISDKARHLENSVISNVYSSLRRYIHDYGYAGMLILQVGIGAFYSAAYNFINIKGNHSFLLIIYGWLAYPLFMQSIDDMLLSTYVYTTSVYWLFYFFIGYYLLLGRKEYRRRKYV